MVHHGAEGVQSQKALADAGVAILFRAAGVETVVDVDGLQSVKADHPVELRQHPVQIVNDIVPGVGHMAGIQTHAQFIGKLHPVKNFPQLLKRTAHLCALSGHGLQQHGGADLRRQDGVQRFGDQGDAGFRALSRVAAGVEVVEIAGKVFHPQQVVRQRHAGELTGALILGAGVDGVGGVGHQRAEAVFPAQRQQRRRVGGVDGLGLAAPGVAGEELQRGSADGQRRFPHSPQSGGGGQMTADIKHSFSFVCRSGTVHTDRAGRVPAGGTDCRVALLLAMTVCFIPIRKWRRPPCRFRW